jgi:hypothetical protein
MAAAVQGVVSKSDVGSSRSPSVEPAEVTGGTLREHRQQLGVTMTAVAMAADLDLAYLSRLASLR